MVSAVDNSGHLYFKMFDGSFTVQVFIDFLQRLVNQSKRKVYLIVDNSSVQKSSTVTAWVNENRTRISFYFLLKYSLDLNRDEYLNNDVKSNAGGRLRAKSKEEMKADISSY